MLTFALFIATVVAWFALEFFFVFRGQPTISERIRNLYAQWPSLGMLAGLAVGLLMGHFFFQ